MNRNGKTNAKKGPNEDYNAYKEFFDRETEAHLIARWMTFAGMQKHEGEILFHLFYDTGYCFHYYYIMYAQVAFTIMTK